MSLQLFKEDVLFYQRFLKSNGFYNGTLDGDWGPKTDKADADFTAKTTEIANQFGRFHSRSEDNIATLTPNAQILARRFLAEAISDGLDVRIISGTRTYSEQNALYRKGRFGNPGPRVTKARGGQSNHNFGVAWDVGIFNGGQYITDDVPYQVLASKIQQAIPEIEWGGNWQSFPDFPHYQHKTIVDSVAAVRDLFEEGKVYA